MGERDAADLVIALNELAADCRAHRRHAEAEVCYRLALAVLDSSVERGHPSRAATRHHYATLLAELGRDAEAAQLEAGR
jgi:hypothetical protein